MLETYTDEAGSERCADTIRRAQELLRAGHTGPAAEVADAIADLLGESLTYARHLRRTEREPVTAAGVRLAEAVLKEWGSE